MKVIGYIVVAVIVLLMILPLVNTVAKAALVGLTAYIVYKLTKGKADATKQ